MVRASEYQVVAFLILRLVMRFQLQTIGEERAKHLLVVLRRNAGRCLSNEVIRIVRQTGQVEDLDWRRQRVSAKDQRSQRDMDETDLAWTGIGRRWKRSDIP